MLCELVPFKISSDIIPLKNGFYGTDNFFLSILHSEMLLFFLKEACKNFRLQNVTSLSLSLSLSLTFLGTPGVHDISL